MIKKFILFFLRDSSLIIDRESFPAYEFSIKNLFSLPLVCNEGQRGLPYL